jgi:hypothetical protein
MVDKIILDVGVFCTINLIPSSVDNLASTCRDFARFHKCLASRRVLLLEVRDLYVSFPVGGAVPDLANLIHAHAKVKAVAVGLDPALDPATMVVFKGLMDSYDIGNAGQAAFLAELSGFRGEFGAIATALQLGQAVDEQKLAAAVLAVESKKLDLARLCEWSDTKQSDTKNVHTAIELLSLAMHAHGIALAAANKAIPGESQLPMIAAAYSAATRFSAMTEEEITLACKFACPDHAADLRQALNHINEQARIVARRIATVAAQAVEREAKKFCKFLVPDGVDKDQFMKTLDMAALKPKIGPFKSALQAAKAKAIAVHPSFATTPEFTQADVVMLRGKAQVNQFAAILLLKNPMIKNLVKGSDLRGQLQGVFSDMEKHFLLEFLCSGLEAEIREVLALIVPATGSKTQAAASSAEASASTDASALKKRKRA